MRLGAALLVFCLVPVVLAAEEGKDDLVPNPPYKNWSAFKKGTTVKLLQTVVDKSGDQPGVIDATARPDAPHETYMTYRLQNVNSERAVVLMTQTEVESGSEIEHAPVRITYPARVHKKYAGHALPKAKVENFKEGDEEVKVGERTIKAHWVESEFKVGNETSTSKVWYSDDVPGGTVKRITTKKEGDKVLFETTTVLVRFTPGK
jgi:hypothetical protein